MHLSDQGPHYLAEVALRALSVAPVEAPDPALLAFFFDVLYEASFRAEQGRQTVGSVLWHDPALLTSSRPCPEKRNWSCLSLAHPVPFNVNSLVSLMQGIDPHVSSLLVYADGPENPAIPVIHGLVSHGPDPALCVPSEQEAPPWPPGCFRAAILGPAHLTVDVGLEQPIELKRNSLHTHAHDVLRRGPARDRLSAHLRGLVPALRAQLAPEIAASPFLDANSFPLAGGSVLRREQEWADVAERLWVDALVQILLQVFQNRQGGAVLISPHPAAGGTPDGPRLRQGAAYPQLRLLLEQRCLLAMTRHVLSAQALTEHPAPPGEIAPEALALLEPGSLAGPAEDDPQTCRAVAFLAALTRLEGILLLTPQLEVNGFGGQPGDGPLPEEVYLAGDGSATESALSALSPRSFGPRNQALIRQCRQDQDAIAFAFTQDGDMRAMMWLNGKVVVWDPVRLRRL